MAERKPRRLGHWGLKLISLLLALLLEVYFYSPNNSVTASVSATVEVQNLPPTMIIVDPPFAEKGIPAQVEISGPSPLVEQVKTGVNKLYVSVPPQVPSEFSAVVDPSQLRVPSGVEVLNVRPQTISFRTERVARKELLVVANKVGQPADGFKVEDVEIFPSTVVIRGPYSKVEGLRAVETQPIDISNISSSQRQEVSLKPQDPLISMGVTIVTVDVKVGAVQAERTFDHVSVKVIAPNGFAATVEPSQAAMVLAGPRHEMEKLESANLVLIADATSLGEGRHEIQLQGTFGDEVRLIKTFPEKVKAHLVKSGAEAKAEPNT